MSKLKIYHTVKGGSEASTEDLVDKISAPVRVKQIQSDGGLWTNDSFIPWASITYIEFEKEADKKEAEPEEAPKHRTARH